MCLKVAAWEPRCHGSFLLISIALTISPHSLSLSLTSPLPLCQTEKLPSYWSPPNFQMPTPSSGPGVRAVTKPVGKGKEDAPHWVQLGFEKVKHFSSTKFQPGQQRGDSVLRPPHTHLIRRSVPSTIVRLAHLALLSPFSSSGRAQLSHLLQTLLSTVFAAVLDSKLIPDSYFENDTLRAKVQKGCREIADEVLQLNKALQQTTQNHIHTLYIHRKNVLFSLLVFLSGKTPQISLQPKRKFAQGFWPNRSTYDVCIQSMLPHQSLDFVI